MTNNDLTNSYNEDHEMALHIFNYLQQHTSAGDSLEGIARWWVLRQRLDESLRQVQAALEELKGRGLVVECRTPDRRKLYFACAADVQ